MRPVKNAENLCIRGKMPPLFICAGHMTAQSIPAGCMVQQHWQVTYVRRHSAVGNDARKPMVMDEGTNSRRIFDTIWNGNIHFLPNVLCSAMLSWRPQTRS